MNFRPVTFVVRYEADEWMQLETLRRTTVLIRSSKAASRIIP